MQINNRYRVERKLGQGSQGDVLLAVDEKFNRQVAIKMLRMGGAFDKQAEQSLRREAMVMASFSHSNVVSVFDYDVTAEAQTPFLVMEYLSGVSVDTLVSSLSDHELHQLVVQVGHALHEGHCKGLVHRDLKPSNLMLVDRGKPNQRFMILDLGIAKLTETAQSSFDTFGGMTFSGSGTPFYMAPEQARAKAVDHRADIYAMGSMIYEIMSGKTPFAKDADSLQELLNAIVSKRPEPLANVAVRPCTQTLSELVMQCLEKGADARPPSMYALVENFEKAYLPSQASIGQLNPVDTALVLSPAEVERETKQERDSAKPLLEAATEPSFKAVPSHAPKSTFAQEQPNAQNTTDQSEFDGTANEPISETQSKDQQTYEPKTSKHWTIAGLIGLLVIGVAAFGVAVNLGLFLESSSSKPNSTVGDSSNSTLDPNSGPEPDVEQNQESAAASTIEKIDLGTQQLNEATPWTLKPNFGGELFSRFRLEGDAPEGLALNEESGRLSWTPSEQQGPSDYAITIVASEAEVDTLHAKMQLRVSEVNQPPSIEPIRDIKSDELNEIRLNVQAYDSDQPNQELTYRLTGGLPPMAKLDESTGQFSWTPREEDGPGLYETTIEVSDGESSVRQEFSIDVREVNTRPEFQKMTMQRIDEDQELTFTIEATDVDLPSPRLVYSFISQDLPGAQFDPATGRFRWTPGEALGPGEFTASFEVSDGETRSELNIPILVNEVARPPVVDSLTAKTITLGESIRYQVNAHDPDLPVTQLRFSLQDHPNGMTIDESTGQIDWAPRVENLGKRFAVTIQVAKSDALVAESVVEINVAAGAITTNSIGMELRTIPAGEFLMGSPETEAGRDGDEKQHLVKISRPFRIGAFEVTRGQFERFVRDTGYKTEAEKDELGGAGWNVSEENFDSGSEYSWRNTGFSQTDDHPVVNVSWNDAVRFCEWLSDQEGKEYRLPTEAEWEFACRAGTQTPFNFDYDRDSLANHANLLDQSARKIGDKYPRLTLESVNDRYMFTAPVGEYRANTLGLYDMHGNVWEWCSDWFGQDYDVKPEQVNPLGPLTGSSRVCRGASWSDNARFSRSAGRFYYIPSGRYDFIGFRVVCELE